MTYRKHWLLQFGGDLPGGEIWSNSIRLRNTAALPVTTLDMVTWSEDNYLDMADDVQAWVERSSTHMATQCTLRFVKLNAIGEDGHYLSEDETIVKYFDETPYPNGVAGAFLPHQVAVVATFTTDAARGRASKGRIYVPAHAIAVDTDMLISDSDALGIANSTWELIEALNDHPGIDTDSVVCSVISNLGSPGPARPITGVYVDQRFDVQRRRANRISADRQTAT